MIARNRRMHKRNPPPIPKPRETQRRRARRRKSWYVLSVLPATFWVLSRFFFECHLFVWWFSAALTHRVVPLLCFIADRGRPAHKGGYRLVGSTSCGCVARCGKA